MRMLITIMILIIFLFIICILYKIHIIDNIFVQFLQINQQYIEIIEHIVTYIDDYELNQQFKTLIKN